YVASKSSFVTSPSFTSATISGIPSKSGSGISACSSFALSSLLSSPHAASIPIINTRDNINNHFFRNINTPFLIMWCHSNTILCVVKNYIPHYILLLISYLLLMLYDYYYSFSLNRNEVFLMKISLFFCIVALAVE